MVERVILRLVLTSLICVVGGSAVPTSAQDAAPQAVVARTWSAAKPIIVESTPALQSAPAIGISGDVAFVAWTDSRNAIPDIYAARLVNGSKVAESRVTNLGPHFEALRAHGASVFVEPSGRAFITYSDGKNIFLARYDVSAGRWLSHTQVTSGLNEWHQIARHPQIAGDGAGNLVIVWEDFRNVTDESNSKGSDIYAETCNGNTMTCAFPNVKVNGDSSRGDQHRPKVARNGNTVVVVWEDERERGPEFPRVYASFSYDGGQSWSANARVSRSLSGDASPSSRDAATNPAVAIAPDGGIYVVWEHHAGSATAPADIYAARWTGSIWDIPQRVDGAPVRVRSVNPAIAAGGAGVYVAWQDYRNGPANPDIYSARWSGSTWVEIPAVVHARMQVAPALAASGGAVHLVWQDDRSGDSDVFMANWNGSGWGGAIQLNMNAAREPYQMRPVLVSDGGTTYAAMLDQRGGYKQIWLARLSPLSTDWALMLPFPTHAARGGDVSSLDGLSLAVAGGRLHAAWSEYVWPHGRQIHYNAYANNGWADPIRLTGSESDTRERHAPVIAANSNAVAAAWSYRDNAGQVQLYASWNTGNGWSTPVPVLQQTFAGWFIRSAIALDANGNLVIVWTQEGANGRDRLMAARRNIYSGGWSYAQISPNVNSDWCGQRYPQLQADSANRLHIVWSGCALRNPPNAWPHDSYIFYATSSDGGTTWSTPLRVGLTVAQNDSAYHNDTSSRPALAVGTNGEVMVLYPSRIGGAYSFYAAIIKDGAVTATTALGDNSTAWARPDMYFGEWYDGDSAGAVAFDPLGQRYIVAFPDRRNGRSPRIYTAIYGDTTVTLTPRMMIPMVRR
ncbi:MAG: hypothetical protein RMN52_17135 [Anaerolineae bacterium]|nr:hypothetical protein [Candidatus Roseilinea sp.]MDW8451723.1 hypothetical protein [Anaerolineae bacterium]